MSKENGLKAVEKPETAAKNETPKAQAVSVQNPELSKLVVHGETAQKQEKKSHSIEEKLLKIEELNELVERRDVIEEALTKVSNFYVSSAGNAQLKFTDSKGGSFGIAHPSVIGEMVHLAKAKLKEELEAIDSKINFEF